jgi:hypothetical protein
MKYLAGRSPPPWRCLMPRWARRRTQNASSRCQIMLGGDGAGERRALHSRKRLQFEVTERKDLSVRGFDETLDSFIPKANGADVAFFFSGYGHQIDSGLSCAGECEA